MTFLLGPFSFVKMVWIFIYCWISHLWCQYICDIQDNHKKWWFIDDQNGLRNEKINGTHLWYQCDFWTAFYFSLSFLFLNSLQGTFFQIFKTKPSKINEIFSHLYLGGTFKSARSKLLNFQMNTPTRTLHNFLKLLVFSPPIKHI